MVGQNNIIAWTLLTFDTFTWFRLILIMLYHTGTNQEDSIYPLYMIMSLCALDGDILTLICLIQAADQVLLFFY